MVFNLSKKRDRSPNKYNNFNEKMHKDNKYYDKPPNFKELSSIYPDFGKYVIIDKHGEYNLKWKDKNAQKMLTKTLLNHDFSIKFWDIPDKYLVPSITSRLNYLLWIRDILKLYVKEEKTEIIGIDIGVGANCIYPLIGNKEFQWKFLGTEINNDALSVANDIIKKNKLDRDILLLKQKSDDKIFQSIVLDDKFYHFNICNPPYFDIDESKVNNPKKVNFI